MSVCVCVCVCQCLFVRPSLNVEPKPIDRSRSNSISRVLLHISGAVFLVFPLTLKLRVVHIKKFRFSQKVHIKQDISNFSIWAPNKPPFLRKILKIHIAYTLRQTKPVLYTKFHGNRFSSSPVMPAQTDTQTHGHTNRQTDKKIIPKMSFSFSRT